MADLDPVARTAMGAAFQRVAHLLVDGEPKVFTDTLAQKLLGISDDEVVRTRAQFPFSTAPWVLRARYAEDQLAEAVARGVTQYVVLGAGLDTFAYRATGALAALRVFEVDAPALQSWKRRRLEEKEIAIPTTCVFVPCDFETQSLDEALAASSFDRRQPAFVSWLGVTQYLHRPAVVETLRWIAGLGAATEVVLTHTVPEARSDPSVLYAAQTGASFASFFTTDETMVMLRDAGFEDIRPLAIAEARARYFPDRTDGLEVPTLEHLVWARVSPL